MAHTHSRDARSCRCPLRGGRALRNVPFMVATEARLSRSLQHVCLTSGLASSVLSLYVWVLATRESGGLSGPFYAATAILLSVLAVGALVCLGLSVRIRVRAPALAEVATTLGCICGLLPPSLTVAWALLQAFG